MAGSKKNNKDVKAHVLSLPRVTTAEITDIIFCFLFAIKPVLFSHIFEPTQKQLTKQIE